MTPDEVMHFSHRLADLTVTAARAQTREQLADVREELVETFAGALTLLSHDAAGGTDLLDALAPLRREGAAA